MTDRPTTRRQVLLGISAASTLALAGCGSSDDGGDGGSGSDGGDGGSGDGSDGSDGGDGGSGDEMEETPTETPTGTANVRVAHMSPNAPNVDVYVDSDDPVLADVPFKTVSDYLEVPVGERMVEITAAGDAETVVFSGAVPVEADTDYSVVAAGEIGDMADQPFEPLVLEDDNSMVGGDQARLRAVHVSPDAPAVDITAGGGEVVLFDGVEYGGSGYTTIEANDYTVQIRGDTENNDGEVVADYDVSLNGGTVYTAFAAGYLTPDDEPADESFDLVVAQDSSS
jgi:hypothetical protein